MMIDGSPSSADTATEPRATEPRAATLYQKRTDVSTPSKMETALTQGFTRWKQVFKLASLGQGNAASFSRKSARSWEGSRRFVASVIGSNCWGALMAVVLLVNMGVVLVDANNLAKCADDPEACGTSFTLQTMDRICMACYGLEVVLGVYVFRGTFFRSSSHVADAFLVGVSLAGELLHNVIQNAVLLRLFRAMRIMRVLRLVSMFEELYLLMLSMISTMRTIFWSCLMLVCVLSVFAILALEVLRPIHKEIVAERLVDGTLQDCYRCENAFDSVRESMVTLFVTLVLGDGIWDILVPMLDRDWRSGIVIVSFIAIIYLGFSNLILSVIVDKANEARLEDVTYQTTKNRKIRKQARRELKELWEEVNEDGDSYISLEDLKNLWVSSATFHDYFKSMDIDMNFLQYALEIMDHDGDGQVSFEEFAESVVKLKNTDAGPVISFVKHQVTQVMHELVGLKDQMCTFQHDVLEMANTAGTKAPAPTEPMVRNNSKWHERLLFETESVFKSAPLNINAPMDVEDHVAARERSAEDLIELLRLAYEEPLPINLPHLRGPERVFADLCQRVEVHLGRLSHTPTQDEEAQLELYLCSARLLSAVSRALPKMLPRRLTTCTAVVQPSATDDLVKQSQSSIDNGLKCSV